MKIHLPAFSVLICVLLLFSGCARVYWDSEWRYEGVVTNLEEEEIQVESDPPASLWVDGKFAAKTPATLKLTYFVSEVCLSKSRYRETPGNEKEVLDRMGKSEAFFQNDFHLLRFKAPGYHDLVLPVEVPYGEDRIRVALRKKTGINYKIDCVLTITARDAYLPEIEAVITEHALGPDIQKSSKRPVDSNDPNVYRRTFRFSVSDAGVLGRLTDTLFSKAKKKNFVFNVSEAKTEATFTTNPSREFRAVWISYLDWPQGETDPERQKASLREMLDTFKHLNFNAVLFQVRAAGEALYRSDIEPWSALLTGAQGRDPGYDPLAFAVREAHKRGMELHAWLNPYRVKLSSGCGSGGVNTAANHITRTRPDWVMRFRLSNRKNCCCYTMLDPGIPDVSEYIARVTADIVERYDVDGIHFDDMFYPYPSGDFQGIGSEDRDTFRRYGRGEGSIADWRRENINRMVRRVNSAIKSTKPYVRFGISPFGIWRHGVPTGTAGMNAYNVIYSDALTWLAEKSLDYLSPQLYWKTGGNPDYGILLPWWARKVKEAKRHIYPGQMVYYVRPGMVSTHTGKPENAYEIVSQIYLNRDHRSRNVLGNAFFRAVGENGKLLGPDAFKNLLKDGLYATPALPPVMPWLDSDPPLPPADIRVADRKDRGLRVAWTAAAPPRDVRKYAVYTVYHQDVSRADSLKDAAHLIAVTGENEITLNGDIRFEKGDYLLVTAVSRNNVESEPGPPIRLE
ncbi:MAG: glycoside hydrolase family 10 protein [Desulfococcaceae bacterium]